MDARAHTHTQIHRSYTALTLPSTRTHSLDRRRHSRRAQTLTLTNKRVQGLRLKDRPSSIITPALRRLAFGLKDSIVLVFFFWQRDGGGVSKMESRPSGARQRQSGVEISDSCFYHPR